MAHASEDGDHTKLIPTSTSQLQLQPVYIEAYAYDKGRMYIGYAFCGRPASPPPFAQLLNRNGHSFVGRQPLAQLRNEFRARCTVLSSEPTHSTAYS